MSAGSNSFWNHVTSLIAGLLARAEDVNAHLDGIAEGFDSVETELGKCIQVTGAGMTTFDISSNAAARADKLVGFDATGAVVTLINNPAEEAKAWATTTGALVESTDYSAKEWAIGTFVPSGSAKEWAITAEDTEVITGQYSALHWAAKAASYAAGANLPASVVLADAYKTLRVNSTGTGYEHVSPTLLDPAAVNGLLVQTAADTYARRSIDVNTDDLQIANPAGTAGNPTLALAFTVTAFIKNLLAAADLATAQSVLEIQTLIDAAKRVTFAGIINSSGPSDATKYYHPNGNVSDVHTSPNVVAAPSPTDFTLTSLRTRLATNTFDGALALTVMVNGVATAATVTYAAGETGAKSWSGSVAISAGDAIEVRFAESATTGNISQLVWAMS